MTEDKIPENQAGEPAEPTRHEEQGHSAGQGDMVSSGIDHIGNLVSKGLGLVEAGIELGVSLANRLTAALDIQAGERPEGSVPPYSGPAAGPYPPRPTGEQGVAPAAPQPAPSPGYVTNRQPLFPGNDVSVSFTINNDSATVAKDLSLRIEGLTGELRGETLDSAGFSVEPSAKVIAPLDFDKFTLTGTIPPTAPGDSYAGWIVVASEEELRIPVRLVVMDRT
jgi:hypothetical protein